MVRVDRMPKPALGWLVHLIYGVSRLRSDIPSAEVLFDFFLSPLKFGFLGDGGTFKDVPRTCARLFFLLFYFSTFVLLCFFASFCLFFFGVTFQ
jgi:hypothetical protein